MMDRKNNFESRICLFCKKKFVCRISSKHKFCSQICEQKSKKHYRGSSYQYICKMLTTKNKTGDAFGITIPRELVEKYNLLRKKFKIDVSEKGIFSIRTVIKYEEIK